MVLRNGITKGERKEKRKDHEGFFIYFSRRSPHRKQGREGTKNFSGLLNWLEDVVDDHVVEEVVNLGGDSFVFDQDAHFHVESHCITGQVCA